MKTIENSHKINIITLGCSKNLVDSEVLMGQLQAGNLEVVHDSNDKDARTVVINTCGFIHDAKEESINTILEFIRAKEEGEIDNVFVMGCFAFDDTTQTNDYQNGTKRTWKPKLRR